MRRRWRRESACGCAAASTGVSMRVMRRGRRSLFIVCWGLGVTGKFAKSLSIVTLI